MFYARFNRMHTFQKVTALKSHEVNRLISEQWTVSLKMQSVSFTPEKKKLNVDNMELHYTHSEVLQAFIFSNRNNYSLQIIKIHLLCLKNPIW